MKFFFKPAISVVVLAVLLGYAGCGNNKPPAPDPSAVALEALSATWKIGSGDDVRLDGKSKKADYASFTLAISGTPGATTFGYTTSGRPQLSAWPSSGSWVFGTDVTSSIVRDPGGAKELAISYVVNGDKLELTFNYQGAGETRTDAVKGEWIFTMSK